MRIQWIVVSILFLATFSVAWVFAQRLGPPNFVGTSSASPPSAPLGGITALGAVVEGRYQQVTVIDPLQRSMAVYHIRLDSGQIELKSVRNIQWDLQLIDFNGQRPLPQEIQSVLTGARP